MLFISGGPAMSVKLILGEASKEPCIKGFI
jgi:hypothetical protein